MVQGGELVPDPKTPAKAAVGARIDGVAVSAKDHLEAVRGQISAAQSPAEAREWADVLAALEQAAEEQRNSLQRRRLGYYRAIVAILTRLAAALLGVGLVIGNPVNYLGIALIGLGVGASIPDVIKAIRGTDTDGR
jgi:hypothetical protein